MQNKENFPNFSLMTFSTTDVVENIMPSHLYGNLDLFKTSISGLCNLKIGREQQLRQLIADKADRKGHLIEKTIPKTRFIRFILSKTETESSKLCNKLNLIFAKRSIQIKKQKLTTIEPCRSVLY